MASIKESKKRVRDEEETATVAANVECKRSRSAVSLDLKLPTTRAVVGKSFDNKITKVEVKLGSIFFGERETHLSALLRLRSNPPQISFTSD